MSYSLHLVPRRSSTQVTMSLGHGDALAEPSHCSHWPNWVRLLQALEPHLGPADRRDVQLTLSAGRAVWLPSVLLSDADLDRLGF